MYPFFFLGGGGGRFPLLRYVQGTLMLRKYPDVGFGVEARGKGVASYVVQRANKCRKTVTMVVAEANPKPLNPQNLKL